MDDDNADAAAAATEQPKAKAAVPENKGPETSAPVKEPSPPTPAMLAVTSRWAATIYGFVELDATDLVVITQ